MAFHNNYNLTKERLIQIFNGNLLHGMKETPKEYFFTLYPEEIGFECIDIIQGILEFIKDELKYEEIKCGKFTVHIDDKNMYAEVYRYIQNKRSFHVIINGYRGKYPIVNLRSGEDVLNNLNNHKLLYTWQKGTVTIIMDVLSSILADEYSIRGYYNEQRREKDD